MVSLRWYHSYTHTHTRGGRQPCRLVPCHPSRLAPEKFRAITQQVGFPVGVLTAGAMTVAMTVGAMTVGVSTVGSMGRPRESVVCSSDGTFIGAPCQGWQPLGMQMPVLNFEKEEVRAYR